MPTLLLRRFAGSLDPGRVFRSVRIVSVGGDTVLPSDWELWKRHFARPCVLYVRFSTTETAELTTSRFDHDTAFGPDGANIGRAVPDKELVVVDDSGQLVPPGVEGDLIVTSAYLADGYWNRPGETARVFTREQDSDRVSYRTGDRGRFLPDGQFAFSGREDQQVKIRGYRVDIREVEATLRQVAGATDAAVAPIKNDADQRLLALVVCPSGAHFDAMALRARMLERLPEWKVPSRFFEVDALPTTLSGKVDRHRLTDMARRLDAEQITVAPASDFADPLERHIAGAWLELLRCDHLAPTDDFFLMGGDSLRATELHLKIERVTGALVPVEELFKEPTVRGMAAAVRRAQRTTLPHSDLPAVLVPFRATGSHEPLFLVHGRPGWSFARPEFLEILGPDQPVYGFQASGLDRSRMRGNTVPAMARQYVEAMKQVQPRGPYFIGSACIGFLVAIEMANQLRAEDERVGPLLLIDPTPPQQIDALYLSPWRRYRKLVRLRIKKLLAWTTWHERKRSRLADRWGDEIRKDPRGYEAGLRARVTANLNFAIARLKYTRWQYDGPILILQSTKRQQNERSSSATGIFGGRFTGHVQWFEAGDSHHDVIRVQSELAARQIRQSIEAAHHALAELRSDVPARAAASRAGAMEPQNRP
jgi:thioesterase domain-containing protein